jgi:chromatin structure-remodeling complex protein RSC7
VENETVEGDEAGEDGLEGGPIGGGKPFRKINGKVYVIEGDEFITEEDPKGNTKIDAAGRLLGGRRFKAQTFNLPQRHPEKMFMLAIDAARTSGFRDSLYYFRRNPLAFKLNATQPEKDYLIEIGKLGPHLRTRSVTLITARSAYKLHGAKMLIGGWPSRLPYLSAHYPTDGRWVVDDYYEDKVLEEITAMGLQPGDLVGDLQDPSTQTELAQLTGVDKQSRVERGGGGGIYRAGGPTTIFGGSGWGPYSDGPLNAVRKSMLTRDGLTEENWMLIAAQRTIETGEEFGRLRREALRACGGVLCDPSSTPDSPKRSVEDENEETKEERRRREEAELPLGVYEPHNGIVVCEFTFLESLHASYLRLADRSDTQPTRSWWEQGPRNDERKILGGTKTGNGAWGLAWVDTIMEFTPAEPPGPPYIPQPAPETQTQVDSL